MMQDLKSLSGGEDLAMQASAAVTSRAMTETIQHRHAHIYHGHDEASDDAKPYELMLKNFGRDHLQPMFDRTHGNATAAEIRAAATAAAKGAARLIAFADKCHRHAARLEAAENEED
jgi:hypothetical protein